MTPGFDTPSLTGPPSKISMETDAKPLSASAASGARFALLAQGSRFGLQLVGIVVLARLLTPADFGVVAMAAALTAAAAIIGDFGFSQAAMQARTLSQQQASNLFWINSAIGLVFTVLVLAASDQIGNFYDDSRVERALWGLCSLFILQSLSTQYAAGLARRLKFRLLALVEVLSTAMGLLGAILLALLGAGFWALVFQQVCTALTRFILLAALDKWRPSWPSRAPMRALLVFGGNTFSVQFLTYLAGNVDSIVVGRFWGATALGLYDRAYNLYRMPMQQIAAPLSRVAVPVLGRLQDDLPRLNRYLQQAQRSLFYSVGLGFALLAALGTPIVTVVLGPTWTEVGLFLRLFAAGGLFQLAGYVYYWAFVATAHTGLQLKYVIITRPLMIALIVLSAPLGARWVAASVSVGLFINWLVLTIGPMRSIGVDIRGLVGAALTPLLVHAMAGLLGWVTWYVVVGQGQTDIMGLVSGLLVMVAAYVLCFMSRRVRSEVTNVVGMMVHR